MNKELATTPVPGQLTTTTGAQSQAVLNPGQAIPKIQLAQGLSDVVKARKAQMGDIIRQGTNQKLGDFQTPLELIPLAHVDLWMLQEEVVSGKDKKLEFRGYEPRTPANEGLEWDYVQNGSPWKRTKVMNLFALLPKDLDAEKEMYAKAQQTGEIDIDNVVLPVCLQLRSMSFKHSIKNLTAFFLKIEGAKAVLGDVPYCVSTLKLSCKEVTNAKGSFYVFNVESAGSTKKEYKEKALSWAKLLDPTKVIVDDSDVAGEPEESTSNDF